MNGTIKVSVLMLTYNQERYIDEAIRSVMLQQTSFPFELVIGNDCSTDDTAAVCRVWKDRYPEQIILIDREQNLGLQQNFIQTYAHCRGEYIAICEGDDFWTNRQKLQRQVDFLDTHPDYSTCFHRVINYYEENGTKSLSNGKQPVDTDIIDLARRNYISNVSAVFRRNLFGPLPAWFNEVSTYDYAIHLLNAQYGKIHYMRKPMAVYRQHGKAIWSRAGADKKLLIALRVRELLMGYFKEKENFEKKDPPKNEDNNLKINEEVYNALRQAYVQISLNLIRYYRSVHDEDGITRTEQHILQYHPEWTVETIRGMEVPQAPTLKQRTEQRIGSLLSWGRAIVSRFIPLSHI